jgi:hypothetical protein
MDNLMKKLILLLTITTLSTSTLAQETSWLDTLKNLVGLGDDKAQVAPEQAGVSMPDASGMVSMLTDTLSVNNEQASGGLGAIFNYVKDNVSSEQFSQLGQSLPGVDSLISQMPDISNLGSSEGIGGLLDKASQYSDSLKAVNDVKKQFEALGLKPEMISSFVSSAQSYLDTEQGQQAKQVLTQGVSKLLG